MTISLETIRRAPKVLLHDQWPSAGVHQKRISFHELEPLCVNDPFGFRSEWAMQRYHIALLQKFIQGYALDSF